METQQQDKILFIGTDEQTAKLAPVKGINSPVILTDVYPAYFCPRNLEKWGIISVNTKYLHSPIGPFPQGSRLKWHKTLETCGLCTYNAPIPASAVLKIMVYTPYGKYGNELITELLLGQLDPRKVTAKEHKSTYSKNLCLTKWLHGDALLVDDFEPCFDDYRTLSSFKDKIHNKSGLEIYYIKAEDKKKRKT